MSNLKNELEALRYMDLKDKFIELGIGEAFKAGVKKVVLIQQAVDLIEKKSGLPEELTVEEVKAEIVKDEVEAAEVELSEFDKAVQAIVSTDGIWTKETISKRIVVLGNIFLQHRSTIKGTEALAKQKVLEAASKLMF